MLVLAESGKEGEIPPFSNNVTFKTMKRELEKNSQKRFMGVMYEVESKSLVEKNLTWAELMIRKAAIATDDSRVIGLSSRDLLAADSWYHEGQFFRVSKGLLKNKKILRSLNYSHVWNPWIYNKISQ